MTMIILHDEWFHLRIADGVTMDAPGIYEWSIEGVGIYIGKFKRKSRPLRHYHRNVRNLLEGKPYRANKPDGFRHIHRELSRAFMEGRRITLTILENPEVSMINQRERELIRDRGTLNQS